MVEWAPQSGHRNEVRCALLAFLYLASRNRIGLVACADQYAKVIVGQHTYTLPPNDASRCRVSGSNNRRNRRLQNRSSPKRAYITSCRATWRSRVGRRSSASASPRHPTAQKIIAAGYAPLTSKQLQVGSMPVGSGTLLWAAVRFNEGDAFFHVVIKELK